MLRWLTEFLKENQEKWEIEKKARELENSKKLEEWEKAKRFEKIKKLKVIVQKSQRILTIQ